MSAIIGLELATLSRNKRDEVSDIEQYELEI